MQELLLSDSFIWFALLVTLWTLPWKGWALWIAARRSDKWWFIALLVLNTLAILEIIYIFLISKRKSLEERQ
jgi:hypothetical protein